jgi:hypothetical protein
VVPVDAAAAGAALTGPVLDVLDIAPEYPLLVVPIPGKLLPGL